MNVPLIANCTMNYPRSISPQFDKQRPPRDKSPQDKSPVPTFGKAATKASYSSNGGYAKKQTSSSDTESFRVYVRARPVSNRELASVESEKRANIIKKEDNMLFVFGANKTRDLRPREEKSYVFDDVFDENDTTIDLYKKALVPALENVLNGYNSTILAYGMTGAGKTHTMFGDIHNTAGGTDEQPGVITLMVKDLLQAFTDEKQEGFQFQMKFSYLEIYNEQIRDLLSQQPNENLMIIEDPNKGITISNLSSYDVREYKDILDLILLGNSKRVMASTNANQFSSRSHAILQITVEKRARAKDIVETYTQSKLCLVDLAGSERAAGSDNRGIRQMEGANINRSLLALGNCINVLSDPNTKGAFVPYRDSKLTRLLKDSLGGNTKTIMVACISPFYMAYEETINTLKYASHARKIKKKVVRNVKEVEMHVSQYKDIIESLKGEIDILKKQLLEKMAPQQTPLKNLEPSSEHGTQMEAVLDSLGSKLIINLEENCELNQTYKELNELKIQNEAALGLKIKELEKSYHNTMLFSKISQEIIALRTVMENNEVIEKEVEENLRKNLQEKKALQERILQVTYQSYQNNQESPPRREKSEKSLQNIGNEKVVDVRNPSFGSNKETQNSAAKDDQISALEKYIQDMQKKLEEKDKQLAHNQQIISLLCQKNDNLEAELTPEMQMTPTISARTQSKNPEIAALPISEKSKQPEEDGPRFSFRELNNNSSGNQPENTEKQKKTPLNIENFKILQTPSMNKPQKSNQVSTPRTDNSDAPNGSPGGLKRNKTVTSFRNRESPIPDYKMKKIPLLVSIEELKKDAEKLKDINLDQVQKKFDQKQVCNDPEKGSVSHRDFFRPPPVQTSSFHSSKKPEKALETEQSKYNSNQSTNRNTLSNDKKIEDTRGDSTAKMSPVRTVAQENKMLALSNFSPLVENNTSSEISSIVPQGNEPSIDRDSFLDIYAAVKGESPQLLKQVEEKTVQPVVSAFRTGYQEIFSVNNMQSIPSSRTTQSAANESPVYLNNAYSEASRAANNPQLQINNSYKAVYSGRTSRQQDNYTQQPSYAGEVPAPINGFGGYIGYSPNGVEPYKPSPSNVQKTEEQGTKRSSSTIRNLGMAREFTKSFRMRLNNLIQAAENNKLNKASIQEISQLVEDYHSNKNYLTDNDFMMLRNLGALALQRVSQQERKETTRTPQTRQANNRSVSANSRARNQANASVDIAIQNPPKSPLEVRKKSPEGEIKSAKKVNNSNNAQSKTKAKGGILSNINSDYSRALNKFCKAQAQTQKGKAEQTKQPVSKSLAISQTPSLGIVSKSPNEYTDKEKERGRNQLDQSRKRSPVEFNKEKDLNGRENQISAFEASSAELEGKQSIIDQNSAQMKMKMKNIRDKFEQMQKQNALKNMAKDSSGIGLSQSASKTNQDQTEILLTGQEDPSN